MAVRGTRAWHGAAGSLAGLAGLALFLMLAAGHLGGDLYWLTAGLILAATGQQLPAVQRWLAGHHPRGRSRRRLVLMLATVAAAGYASGWGPILIASLAAGTAWHIRRDGARLWRTGLVWTAGLAAAGQAALAAGWVGSYLPPRPAAVAAALGVLASGLLIRAYGSAIGERDAAGSAVRASEARCHALVQDAGEVIGLVGQDGRVGYVTPSARALVGVAADRIEGTLLRQWLMPEDQRAGEVLLATARADPGRAHRAELRIRHVEGGFRWIETTMRDLSATPAVGAVVVNCRDVTERHIVQERLAYDANHDWLTGLANRAALLRTLERCFAAGRCAVLLLDLDGFTEVNDALGHEAGDELIVAVAGMLRRAVLGADTVGRLGGDEFGVVLSNIEAPEAAVAVAERILAETAQPVPLAGLEVVARASIGVALADEGCADAGEVLRRAGAAMQVAKRDQAHGYHLYQPGVPAARTHAT
jgi:diguanylate cyclase (GGDEF)-like protein/PAS domain S-box-containing protein